MRTHVTTWTTALIATLLLTPAAIPQAEDAKRPAVGEEVDGKPVIVHQPKSAPKAGDDPVVSLPKEVSGEVGDFIRVKSDTDCKEVRWYAADRGLRLFPPDLLRDSRTAIVSSASPGRYRLIAWTARADIPSLAAECLVVVGQPGPGPGPDPPPPPPPPPDPNQALTESIRTALAAETEAAKVPNTQKLAALFQSAADQVRTSDKSTVYEFYQALRAARATMMGEAIPLVRRAVGNYLDGILPKTTDAPLDATARNNCADAFLRVASLLRRVAPSGRTP